MAGALTSPIHQSGLCKYIFLLCHFSNVSPSGFPLCAEESTFKMVTIMIGITNISLILDSILHPLILPLFHFSHLLLVYVLLPYSMYKDILNAFETKWCLVSKNLLLFFNSKKQPNHPYLPVKPKRCGSSQEGMLNNPTYRSFFFPYFEFPFYQAKSYLSFKMKLQGPYHLKKKIFLAKLFLPSIDHSCQLTQSGTTCFHIMLYCMLFLAPKDRIQIICVIHNT